MTLGDVMRRFRCWRVRGALERWLDSRAAQPMPRQVADHIHDCPVCRAYVTTWNAVELRLRSARDEWPAPQEVEAVICRLERPADAPMALYPGERRTRRRMLFAGAAATALAIVALAVYLSLALRSYQTLAAGGPAAPSISVEAMGAVQREAPLIAPK